ETESHEELSQEHGFVAETAARICERFQLTETFNLPCQPGETPEHYAQRLSEGEHLNNALTFLAFALPKRCSVWWGTRCVRFVLNDPTPEQEAVLLAAERWVMEPGDAHRRAAMELAQQQQCENAACWPAVAA